MNINLLCPQHKQPVVQGCADIRCLNHPFLCSLCLTDPAQLQAHSRHQNYLKQYEQCIQIVSKCIEESTTDTLKLQKYKDLFQAEQVIMRYFTQSEEHLQNLEGYIRTQKNIIEADIQQAIQEWTFSLQLERDNLFDRLDNYLKVYKQNFRYLKDVVDPINFFVGKCRYYANENNLKLKLLTQSTMATQIKMSLIAMQQPQRPETIASAFHQVGKSFESLSYRNDGFPHTLQETLKQIQDHFRNNAMIPDISLIEPPPPPIVVPSPTLKKASMEISLQEETRVEDTKTTTQQIPAFNNVQILDSRIMDDLNNSQFNQLVPNALMKQQKFKIKKKLTLDFKVNSIAIIGTSLVALGLSDGSLKLLDLVSSKVSFYPNTYITHTREVIQLIILKQNKGTRLASVSDENYVIIWTLGENNVPYPERKLVGFKQTVSRILDLADGAHLACQSANGLNIINYNDNRIAYSFESKHPIIEFLYVSKFEKFATVSQNNVIQLYNVKINSVQGANLLVNCQMENTIQAVSVGNICVCIATEHNSDFVLCYGCIDGTVKLFNVLKNCIIADIQLFKTRIVELIIMKTKKSFTLVVVAEGDKQIKAIQIADKPVVNDKFGDLLDLCSKAQGKQTVLSFLRNENKNAMLVLNDNQRDIALYELC